MRRTSGDVKLKPHHAKLGGHQRLIERFGNDRTIGTISGMQAGQRAITGAFFFDNRLQDHRGGGLKPQIVKGGKGVTIGNDAGLHIASPAAIKPVAFDVGIKRSASPLRHWPGWNDINMPV
eukprot:NODE_9459_length_516_cov_2.187661_g9436_i0.p2 GENE.NODE_9459_length_516_cov_2.187661_g9436_i0~~NODE_9459_length_516_cov_2.187661_g9436_i0.p2  ORF type:complete len:121 (+),score=13.43 NODE_9459_length_516_cov_2.187661_g9436_i0:87-449(+)